MSEKLRGDDDNILAGPAEKAAGSLNRISDYLREKEPAELLDDLESLAETEARARLRRIVCRRLRGGEILQGISPAKPDAKVQWP